MKNGTQTAIMVTAKRQSVGDIVKVCIPNTDCHTKKEDSQDAANQSGCYLGKVRLTVTKLSGRNNIETPVNILMFSPCSIAKRFSFTELPLYN